MEAKLKALKVPELKDILAKSNTPAPAKANKADLIAKILATPAAIDLYNKINGVAASEESHDDLLDAPEELDALGQESAFPPSKSPAVAKQSASKPPAPPTASETTTAAADSPATGTTDSELERRKARAARFGIPLVENPVATPGRGRGRAASATDGKTAPAAKKATDNPEKLAARAARFGTSEPTAKSSGGAKRAAQEEVDPEEQERRRKRAERFGTAATANS